MKRKVKSEEVSNAKMIAGNENKYDYVIHNGDLKFWCGIGWLNEGKASKSDKKKYPLVIE